MRGLDSALKAGLKVHTTTVLTKYNLEAVNWLVDLAKVKGFQTEFNFLFEQGTKNNASSFMAKNKDLRKAVKKIVTLKKQGAPILFSEEVYEMAANWPDYQKRLYYNEKPKFKHLPCSAGRFMIFIDVDGLVYPCVQLIGKFPALNFKKVGIKKAWENCLKHPCQACYFPCFNEFNAIAALNPKVILGQVFSSLNNH
jgi:MoaA/NifB/PqqE/SkfB family radical SAM enzyme